MAFRCHTFWEVPERLLGAVARLSGAVILALDKAARESEDEACIAKLLTFLDKLLFCPRPGGGKSRRAGRKHERGRTATSAWKETVGSRLKLADDGDWAALWRETRPTASATARTKGPRKLPEPVRRARRVQALLRAGELGRAAAAAYPRKDAAMDKASYRELCALFPSRTTALRQRGSRTRVEASVRKRIEEAIPQVAPLTASGRGRQELRLSHNL